MKYPRLTFVLFAVAATLSAQSDSGAPIDPVAGTKLSNGNSPTDQALQGRVIETYGRLPLAFEANQGQIDPEVKFLSRGAGYSLFLTPTESVMRLAPISRQKPDSTSEKDRPLRQEKSAVLRMKLVGANAKTQVSGLDELPGKSNYFRGNDSSKWQTNVRQYAKVHYANVYPGVDLVYYGNQRQLEYDFVLRPGADAEQIRLGIEGASRLRLDQGDLVLSNLVGDVHVRRPHVYQESNGKRQEIGGRYVMKSKNEVGFQIGAYDRRRSLIIDPVLSYSTYLGGSKEDSGFSIAVDSAGNAYITGEDRGSTDFPTKNAIQPAYGGGFTDAFVTKINADGSALVYSTYLGGSQNDSGEGIAVDSAGNAYVIGQTDSFDFPTVNAIQSVFNGKGMAFVTKINAAGSALVYSTFLGGTGGENGSRIAVDSAGNAYVTGETSSTDFPTFHAIQPTFGGGGDVFVTKINPAGTALVYSTYLGGSGGDNGTGIAVDSAGNAYVTGSTSSTDFPTAHPIQPTHGGATYDGFVTKITADGSALVYSTYLGGSRDDGALGIAADTAGNAYVIGYTLSTDFPTANAIQPTNHGAINVFVTKVTADGSALAYSTYLGGSGNDGGRGIALDSAGNAYLTGVTTSADFPVVNAIQPTYAGGGDLFVTSLNAAGSAFIYSTYLGATQDDEANAIAVDSAGSAYITGISLSGSFPKTLSSQKRSLAFQPKMKAKGDALVTKIARGTFVKGSPGKLAFQPQGVGTTSQPLKVHLTNAGASSLTINKIYVVGANAGDFAETNPCGAAVAPGASCVVSVTFTPSATGTRKGTLGISDSDPASPQAVVLAGTGT